MPPYFRAFAIEKNPFLHIIESGPLARGRPMRSYYFAISRLSLGIIILQAAAILYLASSTEKINSRIEQALVSLSSHPAPSRFLQNMSDSFYNSIYSFQRENQKHNWILWIIGGAGLLHLSVVYSLYICFLRMGHTWTKLCLHLNNLSIAAILPTGVGGLWFVGYILGTRMLKHFCLASSCRKEDSADQNIGQHNT